MAFPEKRIYNDTHRGAAVAMMDSMLADLDTTLSAIIDHPDLDNRDKGALATAESNMRSRYVTLRGQVLTVILPASEDPLADP